MKVEKKPVVKNVRRGDSASKRRIRPMKRHHCTGQENKLWIQKFGLKIIDNSLNY